MLGGWVVMSSGLGWTNLGQTQPGHKTRPLFTQGLKAQARAAESHTHGGKEEEAQRLGDSPRSCFRMW